MVTRNRFIAEFDRSVTDSREATVCIAVEARKRIENGCSTVERVVSSAVELPMPNQDGDP